MLDAATVLWIAGLSLLAGAIGWAINGTVTAVVAVGAVWFFAGVAGDMGGGD